VHLPVGTEEQHENLSLCSMFYGARIRQYLGRVSSPLCVNELGLACNQTQLCHIGVFIDCVEQLRVSAFIGHRQVLREINKLH